MLNPGGRPADTALVNPHSRRIPWWTPLLVPVVVLVLTALSTVSRGAHSTYTSAITGGVLMALLVGLPAFIAGVMYRGSTDRYSDDRDASPTGSGPA